MTLGPRLHLRQSQQLVMTPRLRQAVELLAMSNQELENVLSDELEQNPLLDIAQDDNRDDQPRADDRGEDGAAARNDDTSRDESSDEGSNEGGDDVDYDADVFHHDAPTDRTGSGTSSGHDDLDSFENRLTSGPCLRDILLEQANRAFSRDPADILIAERLIDLIDVSGYFTGNIEEISADMGAPPARVTRILETIQTFEPSGVGARTLRECLTIQARDANRLDPPMRALLDHLDLVARGDLATLRRLCKVDHEDMADMIRELRAYDPRPGLVHAPPPTSFLTPDIFVKKTPKGWSVELNQATLPRLLVRQHYHAELINGATRKEDKRYLNACLASAQWIARTLDKRAQTILKVALSIVKFQKDFFEKGVLHMRQLAMREIAEDIGMHESTVSRAIANKSLACARGIFELKYFFNSAIAVDTAGESSLDSDEAASSSSLVVKARIRALIKDEKPDAILSDDKLLAILRAEGFHLARRTVAKYREAEGFGSSVQRRRAATLHSAL